MTTPWTSAPWEPRKWQREALSRIVEMDGSPLVRAVTGAGKSILIAELAYLASQAQETVLVTTPTVQLVDQLSATLKARGLNVGKYYTHEKKIRRVTVCCNPSLQELAKQTGAPGLWIADECHKTETDEIKSVIESWTPRRRLGVTATPYRADEKQRLTLFDQLAYNYSPADAIRDGVVVPPKVEHYTGTQTDINLVCLEMIRGAHGPGVVDAANIKDAEEFSVILNNGGVRAKTVHSKLHDATVQKRIKALEAGDLDCLVSVSMLVEGVDFPWLRWLCCRRPISSRVRFAQYIGRGLRCYPDKKYCVVYDPHDLFGRLSLDYAAILGIDEDDPELEALQVDFELTKAKENLESEPKTMHGVPVRLIDPTVSYIRKTCLFFQCEGYISFLVPSGDWYGQEPTAAQLNAVGRMSSVLLAPEIPWAHKRALVVACRSAPSLTRRDVTELLEILRVLQKYEWPEQSNNMEVA